MMSAGVPWWLAQHPNEYSANPNEVLKYRNQEDFIQSPFYEKYKKRFTESFVNLNVYYNKNVNYIFYNKQLFQDTMKDENNNIEKEDKKRKKKSVEDWEEEIDLGGHE